MEPNNELPGDWSAFKAGDEVAFARIYQAHAKPLLKFGYKIHAERSLVEDCVQDLFVELWKSRANLSDPSSVKFYLFRALRYKILRNINSNSHMDLVSLEEYESDSELPFESEIQDLVAVSDQFHFLRETIESLPPRQKQAVNLRFFNNFKNEEVAQIMGVNYKSACRFIYMAIRKLKANLKVPVS